MPLAPFQQLPFAQLPEHPARPHAYFASEALELDLDSKDFGRMRVHVRRHGSGPPLLLVHGLMTSSYSWRYALPGLGAHFTCYAPDLPSNGHSARPLTPRYSAAALARWLLEVQTALGIRGCAVVGNSMGGYLTMRMALEDPASLRCLVNLHSPGLPEVRLWALKAALALPGTHALLRWLIRRDPVRWAARNVHYYDESIKSLEEAHTYGDLLGDYDGAQGLVKYLAETMDPSEMVGFARRLRALERFPVPLLLVYAERDPMVPPRIGDRFARLIPSAQLVRLREASHFAHVDATDRFLAAVLPFLRA